MYKIVSGDSRCGVDTALVVRFADRNKLSFVFEEQSSVLKKYKTFFIYSNLIIYSFPPSNVIAVDN